MIFTPRNYQHLMIEHALEVPRGGLFAGMGLGKTTGTLCAIDILQMAGIETKPAIVFAPKRVAQSTWPDEARKWSNLNHIEVQPIIGTAAERIAALGNTNAAIFTINYENIPWLMETLDGRWPFGMAVADESTKLKNLRMAEQVSTTGKTFMRKNGGSSTRAAAIGRIAHTKCTRWLNLTGTPAPNGLIDLYGQTWLLDKGQRLGRTFEGFKSRWFDTVGEYNKLVPRPFAQEQISTLLKDICLSLKAEDYFDLKEPIVSKVMIELPDKIRALYKDMEKRMYMEIEGVGVEAFNAGSKTQKCLQLANGAVYIDHDVTDDDAPKAKEWKEVHDLKLQALESIVAESGGMPVLVAYHFKSDLARLRKAFPTGRLLDDNPQTIRDWNAGKIPLLFAHPASAGHGLSLQDGGNIIVYFAINWNLENHLQILERIGPVRQMQSGHNRPVYVYYILARGTVDEDVLERLETKDSVQNILRNAMRRIYG